MVKEGRKLKESKRAGNAKERSLSPNITNMGLIYQKTWIKISKSQSKLERLRRGLEIKIK